MTETLEDIEKRIRQQILKEFGIDGPKAIKVDGGKDKKGEDGTLASLDMWKRLPGGDITVWDGVVLDWVRIDGPKANTPKPKSKAGTQGRKVYKLDNPGRRVNNLIGCICKVHHMATMGLWNIDRILGKVDPLLDFVGGRKCAEKIVTKFKASIRRRLHESGEDAAKRGADHDEALAVLILGRAYGNSVDLTSVYAIAFAKRYASACIKYNKEGRSQSERRVLIDRDMERFVARRDQAPEQLKLFYKFGAHKRVSRALRSAYNILPESERGNHTLRSTRMIHQRKGSRT